MEITNPLDKNLPAERKIKRSNVFLQKDYPFFGFLSFYLDIQEAGKDELPEWAGAGVDEKGVMKYRKEFIDRINVFECMGVIAHEILHVSFLHISRGKNKEPTKWGIAIDIVTNQILKDNDFTLPKKDNGEYDAIVSDESNTVSIFGNTIKNCDKKTAEQIYDELKIPEMSISPQGFDSHIESRGMDEEQREELSKKWEDALIDAYNNAKMQGKEPEGIERLIGKLHEEKIDWKTLLERYIVNEIPYDFSYNKPSRKSLVIGEYLPDTLKEKIDIMVALDLSGSIGQQELNDFLSEIIGIGKAYRSRINMRILTHEVYVNGDYEIDDDIDKIKSLQIKGGGGTAFTPMADFVKEKYPQTKLLVWFTDGCAEPIKKQPFEILWVISENGMDDVVKNSGRVVRLDGKH